MFFAGHVRPPSQSMIKSSDVMMIIMLMMIVMVIIPMLLMLLMFQQLRRHPTFSQIPVEHVQGAQIGRRLL